jgi:hypothetical protein
MTYQFQLFEWGHYNLGKLHGCLEVMSGSWDVHDYATCWCTPLWKFSHEV